MSPHWINMIEASKVPALVVSLCFNVVLCAAIAQIWKSREALQGKVTEVLTGLITEMDRRYWSERKN